MKKSHGLKQATTLVVLLTLCASSAFAADVNKCVSGNGKVTYTDAPCPADTASTKALSTPVDQSAMCPDVDAVGCIEMTDIKVIEHFEKNAGLHSGPYSQAVVTRVDANKCVMFDAHESVKLVKHWDNRRTLVKRAGGGEYWVTDKWLKPGKCP